MPAEDHIHHYVSKQVGINKQGEGVYILVCDCDAKASDINKKESTDD